MKFRLPFWNWAKHFADESKSWMRVQAEPRQYCVELAYHRLEDPNIKWQSPGIDCIEPPVERITFDTYDISELPMGRIITDEDLERWAPFYAYKTSSYKQWYVANIW